MAVITIDPAVLKISTTTGTTESGTAGEAISSTNWLYQDASRTYFKAKADNATTAVLAGIAMNNAISGGVVLVNKTAPITTDAVLTKDVVYVLSAGTAGKVMPQADLATGNIISIAGVASATTGLVLGIVNTGIVKT